MADTGAREPHTDAELNEPRDLSTGRLVEIVSQCLLKWQAYPTITGSLRWSRNGTTALNELALRLAAGVGVPPDEDRITALRIALKQIRRESTYRGPERLRTIAREAMEADERALAGVGEARDEDSVSAPARERQDARARAAQHARARAERFLAGDYRAVSGANLARDVVALTEQLERLAGVGEARPADYGWGGAVDQEHERLIREPGQPQTEYERGES